LKWEYETGSVPTDPAFVDNPNRHDRRIAMIAQTATEMTRSARMLKDYITTITILENISDAIFNLDNRAVIQYANHSALDMLRTELDHLIGKPIINLLFDLVDPDGNEVPEEEDLICRLMAGSFDSIEANLRSEHIAIPVILNFKAIADFPDQTEYVIVTAKNIYYRQKNEYEARQKQALSISLERLKYLGELSINMVHDLTQPLASLQLYTDLMGSYLKKETVKNPALPESMLQIRGLIDRMTGIINRMRAFANQTENDAFTMVNIKTAIETASGFIAYDLEENQIELKISQLNPVPPITTNSLMLEQVFFNLFKNSKEAFDDLSKNDATPVHRGKEIIVIIRTVEDKWIEVVIHDNAGGIKPGIQDKIFEPFFTTKPTGWNTGVGLSVAKSIITTLGGDIRLVDSGADGTTFRIRIPVSDEEEQHQLFNLIEMHHKS